MGQGDLTVKTSLANEEIPVSDAYVTIKDMNNNVLHTSVTDDSGLTECPDLYAPDKSFSLNPGYTGIPYSECRVSVSKPGYVTEVINGVEIFDTQESILNVDMHPLVTGENPEHVINLPENHLIENPVQNTQAPRGGRAPRNVFVPDFITIHLGQYNASARNVRVPFALYIKNVASSEIYPTWPASSLEANIRAIMNIALNRIYTEWYRSRGYNFDITNSVYTDQAFTEGHEIYLSISVIVDRILGEYLRRPNLNEPFFTSYCDGRISNCSGLLQWGTVTLANNGYTPMQILRYYYPNDLNIYTAPINPIIESFPGLPLSQGTQGSDVQLMQLYLNRIRQDYPLIPAISNPNGVFGTTTTDAVKIFQQISYLPQTGVIDRATWNKISWYYVAVTRLGELNSEGDRIVLNDIPPNTAIGIGASGGLVSRLQFMINFIAEFYSDIPVIAQDGAFGSATRNAVIAFQQRFGLTPDGVVGPGTWSRLYSIYFELKDEIPEPPPVKPEPPTPPGSGDPAIRQIQSTLNSRYNTNLVVDGIFGRLTKAALVIGLQTELNSQFGRNLVVDGIFGPATRAATININPGARGNLTYLIQAALYTRGYTSVIPDGIFGPLTQAAVQQFQRDQGLPQNGIATPATQERLFI
ncbi:MAG: peptidoglycan-binding protein [Oscillospiraceae bacterium]|jgi:peptidoglycan hydrolase-like protein with peptidoglycan-binding domain|nr:peptidoglycan-binding protein [Oscillospiraceae bacterium]